MFIGGDLPVRGFVGQLEQHVLPHTHKVFLWTHLHFEFEYNGNQIVGSKVSEKTKETQLPVDAYGADRQIEVQFTYSATWTENTA
jgi:transmembrane 9 superfamily protein 1